MTKRDLLDRTKAYAVRAIAVSNAIAGNAVGDTLGRQLLRSACSVGANYRAACRAKSTADFVNKLKIVEEECDETLYWMELLIEAGVVPAERLKPLMAEGDEIPSMVVASLKTTKANAARHS